MVISFVMNRTMRYRYANYGALKSRRESQSGASQLRIQQVDIDGWRHASDRPVVGACTWPIAGCQP
jgi:hypothetical protein